MKRGIKKFLEVCCITGTILIGAAFLAFVTYLIALGLVSFVKGVKLRPADLPADTPSEGVAWIMPESAEAAVWMAPACAEAEMAAYMLDTYTEGDGPAPEWWRPEEPMSAEWVDHSAGAGKMADDVTDINVGDINVLCNAQQSDAVDYIAHPPIGIDPGGVDWNLCTTVWGWDGHSMEVWELDLFSMIFYREFWQPNMMLCEAGCDAMLQLWDLNGGTMYETLSHVNENGSYAFSTFPGVYEAEYDPDGLAWCRAYCEERFYNGPVWPAQYFRKGQYHDWDEWSPIPAYEIDGIYFSIGNGGN